ncbi:E3 ubiquitin-protein ligase listerin isoform X2 [Procambarus clarkii]|uniref:E3 ubiquitin-protein ligase listerin isoform X2 n=1 Tax=Procambarus clarkii TaxID=6728 RepID=UPI001E67106C|nr:E3 ubiquitin-protein ligase listerin-like isoform X2 [Procambarus clarkii]
MGKDKNAQRTKGNKKPSSSGRTAELLGGATGFVGFSVLQDLGYVPAASQAVQTDDSAISAEFRVTLRKMTKKDSTTKIKALQEFEALCQNEDQEAILSALPFWPRLYSKLSVDIERRVREATQIANGALVAQVGKQLAPHLKSIMPSWILSMVDPHPPAAIAASKAFQDSFAVEKRAEVMIFTCKEIMDHITDNLFTQTAQTLSDPKVTDPEDMKNKYIRVLASSLNAVSLLLTATVKSTEKKPQIILMISTLVENPSFWKIPKNKHPMVRSAWFSTVKDMFEYDPKLLGNSRTELSSAIIPALDDQDGTVLPHIWIAFLHLCVTHPEFWGDKSSRSVFKRMYSVMRDGARGSAGEWYPQLLPIISVIPEEAMDDKCTFYTDFFRAMTTGLLKDRILSNSRDVSSVIISLFECLSFVSKKVNDPQLWDALMKYQVVELLRSSFIDTPQLSTSKLYREVAGLLRFFSWKSQHEEIKFLSFLLDLFWKKFIPECEILIHQGNETTVSKMINFFNVLRNPDSKFSHRREGIKFNDEVQLKVQHADDDLKDKDEKEKIFLENTGMKIAPLTLSCHTTYMQEKNVSIYNMFSVLLSSFPSPSVYSALLYGLSEEKLANTREVLEQVILPKMEGENPSISQPTINIFMSLYVLMEQDEQKLILMNFKPCLSVSALRLLIEKMTERRESDEVAAAWLLSSQLGCRLVQLVDRLCGPVKILTSTQHLMQQDELISLFNFVLRNGNQKEPVIAMDYISQILTKLSINLRVSAPNGSEPEERIVQLVANLAGQLFGSYVCWQTRGIHEFMKSLFLLLCQSSKSLSEDTVDLIKITFLKGFQGLITSVAEDNPDKLLEEGSCLSSTLKDIKQTVLESTCTYHLTMTMAELTQDLMRMVFNQVPKEEDCSIILDHSKTQVMLDLLMPTEGEWADLEAELSPLYVAPAVLQGTISLREFPFPKSMHERQNWEHTHTRMSMFLCDLLLFMCGSGDDNLLPVKEEQVSLGKYTHLVVSALHSTCHATVMQELNDSLQNNTVSEDMRVGTNKLNEDMKCLMRLLNQGNKRLITKQIKNRCNDGSSSWCVTLIKVLTDWMKSEDVNIMRLMEGLEDSALGFTATKQSLLSLLPQEIINDILAEEMGKLSSYSDDPFSATPSVCIITTALNYVPSSITKDVINSIFLVLTQWREKADNIFLFATDVTGMAWEDIVLTCSLVRLVTVLIKRHAIYLEPSHWDFVLCLLSSWVQSLEESRKSADKEIVTGIFTCAVCKCIGCVSEFMEKLTFDQSEKEKYPPKLLEDWKEFFSPSIYNSLIPIYVDIAVSYSRNPSIILYGVCRAVCIGVCHAGPDDLANHTLPSLFNAALAGEELKLPDSEQILLNHLTPLLLSSHPPTQFTAYSLLKTFLPRIMSQWEMNQISVREEEDTPQRPLPYSITQTIQDSSVIVESTLAEKEMGDGYVVMPHTKSFTHITGYLLAWRLALAALTYASDANQHQYSTYLRQTNLLQRLLLNLFKLMPQTPLVNEGTKLEQTGDDKSLLTIFNTQLYISPLANATSQLVAQLACKAYYECVSRIPAAVRQWFISLDRHYQPIVDGFTTLYVSPLLINQEMSAITNSSTKFDNMTVKARPGAREVVATYSIDETSMELILRLAPNHPLTTVTVDDHRRVGVSVAQWRNWLLVMNTMLSHRNTPLLQSLVFWKQNVDQKFEGIEECFICYYVLHGTNHQLPKLLCRTCKKKFHSACLYKWFNSSNNSTCPLCRSLF